jgi:ATP-binding protein involved in chromosome partitioning
VQFFTGDRAAPMRGREISDALVELFAVTNWGELDVLVVDRPPGLGDAMLDAIRLLPDARYLVVANASAVVLETVRRTVRLLKELGVPIEGIVENMARGAGETVAELSRAFSVPWLGAIPFDPGLEEALGDPERIAATAAARAIESFAARIAGRG